ncbi:hypothetical protein [Paenibacillus sp. RUD330]|uniref:hypothetical protein n=1 Tax=Paenibacillus sp. RUD330 TaxID=2023772 RepID=UPI000B927113|nr:hypothetical protein [Paenibacillus sp. RUD330]ASS66536.1 hypothetical protein CIC07_10485 [Paenibacillus sp. RUD330]
MYVVGLIGGIIGAVFSAFALMIAMIGVSMGLGSDAGSASSSVVVTGSIVACLVSVLAIFGAVISKRRPRTAGIFHFVAAVVGVIGISMFYFIPAILLIVSGFMGVLKKDSVTSEM